MSPLAATSRRRRRRVTLWSRVGLVVVLLTIVVLAFASRERRTRSHRPAPRASLPDRTMRSRFVPLGEPGVGGRVTGLAVDPVDPGRVLVAGDVLGVGLSVDGGRSWGATSGFASWEMNAFSWDVSDPARVWVGSMSGPYESVDGGRTWVARRVGLPAGDFPYSAPVQKVLIDSSDDQRLLAFGGNQRAFWSGGTGALNYGLVYESSDGGAHWSTVTNIGMNWNIVDVVGSGDLRTLYAAVYLHGVYKSTDGGRSWQAMSAGLPNADVRALAVDPDDPDTVWAAVNHASVASGGVYAAGGIYKTTDGARSWVSANNGIPQISRSSADYTTGMLSVFRAGDGTLYTADQGYADQNRYQSTDGGAHWTRSGSSFVQAFPAGSLPFVWASSADGAYVIGGTVDSLVASRDHGATWFDTGSTRTADGGWHGDGFSGLLGTRIAFSPTRSGDMFTAGYDAGNLWHSTNGGVSWRHPLGAWDSYNGGYDLAVGGTTGQSFYEVLGQAHLFNGIAVSQDDGQTFTYHAGGTLPARGTVGGGQGAVAVASSDGQTAYAALPDERVYVTTDGGSSWSPVAVGSAAFAVAASPGQGAFVATSAGVYAIARAGAAPVLMTGSPGGLRRLIVANGSLYGAGVTGSSTQSGLWSNQGGTWQRWASNLWIDDVAVDPYNSKRIVYVTNDNPYHDTSFATGVWVSCNGGQTFSQYNNGLPMLRALSVTFNPWIPGRLVVGLNGRGYWQTQLPNCNSRAGPSAKVAGGLGRSEMSGSLGDLATALEECGTRRSCDLGLSRAPQFARRARSR